MATIVHTLAQSVQRLEESQRTAHRELGDQITQLREVFTKFDQNGDGKLSIEELKEGI